MKPPLSFIISSCVIIISVFVSIFIQHHYVRHSLDMRSKERMIYTNKLEDFKKELNNNPDAAVTKADLAAMIDMNSYQSQKDKLYMDNKFELARGYPMVFPDYFILIMILWLSYQLDSIRKQLKSNENNEKNMER